MGGFVTGSVSSQGCSMLDTETEKSCTKELGKKLVFHHSHAPQAQEGLVGVTLLESKAIIFFSFMVFLSISNT